MYTMYASLFLILHMFVQLYIIDASYLTVYAQRVIAVKLGLWRSSICGRVPSLGFLHVDARLGGEE